MMSSWIERPRCRSLSLAARVEGTPSVRAALASIVGKRFDHVVRTYYHYMYGWDIVSAEGGIRVLSETVDHGNRDLDQQDALARLRRVYSFLNSTNEAIVRIKQPEPLFDEACRIAVEVGGFRMAWIGLVDSETGQVRPVTHRGFEEGYLQKIFVSARGSDSRGRGPTGTAVREGSVNICNDFEADPRMGPWREEALKRGYKSSGAFPLQIGDRVVGALTMYAPEKYWFSSEEVELFKSLTENISLAVGAMEQEAELRDYRDHLERKHA